MKKGARHIPAIIVIISAALVGLVSLQAYLLFSSYEQKEQAFDRNVLNALNAVSQSIEKDEAASKIFSVALQSPGGSSGVNAVTNRKRRDSSGAEKEFSQSFSWIVSDSVKPRNGNHMRVEVFHSSGIDTMTSILIQGQQGKNSPRKTIGYRYSTDEHGMRINADLSDSIETLLQDTTKQRRGEIVARVVDKLFLLETLPLKDRITVPRIDSLLTTAFHDIGITLPYTFAVFSGQQDSIVMKKDSSNVAALTTSRLKTQIFPSDVISPRYELAVVFPGRVSYILQEMTLVILLSVLFMVIIIVSFIVVIRTIVLQKRFGESVINFINNMTHEFKTPISTIALASEAIARPETIRSKAKLLKYNSVIADENRRMKEQVDTILQMAVLEEGEFELQRTTVHVHDLIRRAVMNLSFPVEEKHGTISTTLRAEQNSVYGDPVHLMNIIHNVLDNAVKYSPQAPSIVIETAYHNGMISVIVRDSGIGISHEHLDHVFDKYYRVPTGNTHDVKGFGLGLSYVKLIAEAHGGTVRIASVSGKGTTVEITLPVSQG